MTRAVYDGGALIAAGGELLASGERFSFRDWLVASAVIDLDALLPAEPFVEFDEMTPREPPSDESELSDAAPLGGPGSEDPIEVFFAPSPPPAAAPPPAV